MADKAVGSRQPGGGFHLFIRGVQPPVADVVRHGPGEQVGVLEHHAQGAPKGLLGNVLHVQPVVGDGSALDFVEAVDEAGDGGFPCASGAHKGNLLSGLGKEGYVVKDGPVLVVAEGHVAEPHVPPEGDQGSIGLQPGPGIGVPVDPGEGPAFVLRCPDQADFALVVLRRGLHDLKDALRASHGGEEGVYLLGNLGDGLAHLPGVLEEGRQAPQVPVPDGQEPADAAGDGVVDIVQVSHGGHHHPGEDLGPRGRVPVGLVPPLEPLLGLPLVVKDLDDFLALDHFLDIAVDLPQGLLLVGEVPPGAGADGFHHQQHHRQGGEGDQGQRGTEDQHHGDGAGEVQRTGDQASEAVVQGLGDGFNVVGVAAHQLAVGVGVKEFQGQVLHVPEEVRPDFCHGGLGNVDHDTAVAEGAHRAQYVHHSHDGQHPGKAREVAGENIVVDQGADQVGASHGAGGAGNQQRRYQDQMELVASQVAHELPQGAPDVLGLAEAAAGTAGSVGAGSVLSHRCFLLPAGTGRPPGRYRRPPSAPRGCPGRRCARRPSPGLGPPPGRRPPAGR